MWIPARGICSPLPCGNPAAQPSKSLHRQAGPEAEGAEFGAKGLRVTPLSSRAFWPGELNLAPHLATQQTPPHHSLAPGGHLYDVNTPSLGGSTGCLRSGTFCPSQGEKFWDFQALESLAVCVRADGPSLGAPLANRNEQQRVLSPCLSWVTRQPTQDPAPIRPSQYPRPLARPAVPGGRPGRGLRSAEPSPPALLLNDAPQDHFRPAEKTKTWGFIAAQWKHQTHPVATTGPWVPQPGTSRLPWLGWLIPGRGEGLGVDGLSPQGGCGLWPCGSSGNEQDMPCSAGQRHPASLARWKFTRGASGNIV